MSETEPKKPWDQKEGEPDSLYTAFLEYLGQGKERTIASITIKKNKKSENSESNKKNKRAYPSGYILINSSRWSWKERAESWDKELAIKATRSLEEKVNDIKETFADTISIANKKVNEIVRTDDREKLTKMAPWSLMFLGKGRAIEALTNAHKAIVGEKHSVVEQKVIKLEFE